MPLVSIILPIYNAEEYLDICLRSLINQTYKNFEVLCIDDGSFDSSLKILNDYSAKDSRIKVFSQKNSGPAAARNLGIKNTAGKYLMFCDSDDWYEPNMVEEMVNAIEKYDTDIVMCDCNIHRNGEIINDNSIRYHKLKLIGDCEISTDNIAYINRVLWNKIFRKDIIENNKLSYPIKYEYDDCVFICMYLSVVKKYFGLDKTLYNYRLGNPNSIMGKLRSGKNINHEYDFCFAFQHLIDFYIKSKFVDENIKQYFINFIYRCIKYFYSLLTPEKKSNAYIIIIDFVKKNVSFLKNDNFISVLNCKSCKELNYVFNLPIDYTLSQKFFSVFKIKNRIIIHFLGLKLTVKYKD
ncbi:glycosyltransferase family 2 protein [bacterium]|nr:glycosyltransferase family 2 protein [bacterium]